LFILKTSSSIIIVALAREVFFGSCEPYSNKGREQADQQLHSNLFVRFLLSIKKKLLRRKLIEILLALWFNAVCSKPRQLDMYLASVRFENGVFGIAAAIKHFFGNAESRRLSAAEAFFLIERVSNIRSLLLADKINQTLQGAVRSSILTVSEAKEVVELYARMIEGGKVLDTNRTEITRLREAAANYHDIQVT
jgi:penicillin-binding protein 1A